MSVTDYDATPSDGWISGLIESLSVRVRQTESKEMYLLLKQSN